MERSCKITLGEATKLLDNIMTNYSQWHTERSPTSKKVHAIEEIVGERRMGNKKFPTRTKTYHGDVHLQEEIWIYVPL